MMVFLLFVNIVALLNITLWVGQGCTPTVQGEG